MYTLSEEQIDFILRDIKSRGVEMEDLQVSLLDHICCILECELEPDGDFESFYRKTIPRFFKKELREIEEETILLLTFKNYYAMKKVMMISGLISVVALIAGSFLKIMHWPGANFMLLLGITSASLLFMPILFILKTKESNSGRDKLVLGIGTFFGILISLSTLFKVMHWPYANSMWLISLGILFFIFIPLYFFTGIRNTETKVNTMTSTILLVLAGGLLFILTSLRPSYQIMKNNMYSYIQNEQILHKIQNKLNDSIQNKTVVANINRDCEAIKEVIIQYEIGEKSIPADFEAKDDIIKEGNLSNDFYNNGKGIQLLSNLKKAVDQYNPSLTEEDRITVKNTILDADLSKIGLYSNLSVLNSIVQVQMCLANSQMK